MRRVAWILLILSTAVGLALLMRFNHGNVAVLWPPYRIDLSVNLAILVLVASFLLLHLLLLGLSRVVGLPTRVREYRARRQLEAARAAFRDSLLALFEGRFGRAERLAQLACDDPVLSGAAALVAARAAHRMRETDRRDRWLLLAAQDKGSINAELMSTAELAIEEQDTARAIAAIDRLHGKGLRHIHSLRVSVRAGELSEDWMRVLRVLRSLEKRDALPDVAIRGLRVRACRALFAAREGDAGALRALWGALRPVERELPETVEAAASALSASGHQEQACRLIEAAMEREMSPMLLPVYAALTDVPARERIQNAEQWRARHGEDPDLALALGRMCMAEAIWGKAEDYFLRSLQARDSRAAHIGLAELAQTLGRPEMALEHWRLAARAAH